MQHALQPCIHATLHPTLSPCCRHSSARTADIWWCQPSLLTHQLQDRTCHAHPSPTTPKALHPTSHLLNATVIAGRAQRPDPVSSSTFPDAPGAVTKFKHQPEAARTCTRTQHQPQGPQPAHVLGSRELPAAHGWAGRWQPGLAAEHPRADALPHAWPRLIIRTHALSIVLGACKELLCFVPP